MPQRVSTYRTSRGQPGAGLAPPTSRNSASVTLGCACPWGRGKNVGILSRSLQSMLEGRRPCRGMGGATVHVVICCCSLKCMAAKYTASMRLARYRGIGSAGCRAGNGYR